MGVAVTAGMLEMMRRCDAEGFAHWGQVFAQVYALFENERVSLGGWHEPEGFVRPKTRRYVASFSYGYMRLLVRARARQIEGRPVVPEGGDSLDDDAIFADASSLMSSHVLLVASGTQGVFLPREFDPVSVPKGSSIPGVFVGSTQGLVRELVELAPALGVELRKGALSTAEAKRVFDDRSNPFERERTAWLALWECARVSVECGVSLVLH